LSTHSGDLSPPAWAETRDFIEAHPSLFL